MSRTLSSAFNDAAQEGTGIQVTTANPAFPLHSYKSFFPVWILCAPRTSAGARSWDPESEPTRPIIVYHSNYFPIGKLKGWEAEKQLWANWEAQGSRNGPWCALGWAEVEAWFNTWRKLKLRLNKNTTVDVSNLCQTITNQPCSDMLAGFLGQQSIPNLSSFS